MAPAVQESDEDRVIEQHKISRLIKRIQKARGNGTSMISLIIRPKDEISKISRMLQEEYGTASNIKSRVNRLSVLAAITSAVSRLKLYRATPPNGLVVYTGTVLNDEGKERKMNIDFEPFKPLNTSLYMCDNKFHCDPLQELLQNDDRFGFIVMDGSGCVFGSVQGSNREIHQRLSVELPKKHGRGGQSAMRFARIRLEKRQHYVRKVAENATTVFVSNDKCNVKGIILAGSAEFKNELMKSDLFDCRLSQKVVKIIDVAYGGENGFNQAIEICSDFLANVKFIQEKKVITGFMEEVAMDSGKYCFGIKDTMTALEMGAIDTIIVWDNLDYEYVCLKNANGDKQTKFLTATECKDEAQFKDGSTGEELDIEDRMEICDWLCDNYKNYGAHLQFVTDCSQEGSQFVKGFGGIGGMLRYRVDFEFHSDCEMSDDEDFM